MDICAWVKSVNHDNLLHNMQHFFDENIAAYNIINSYNIGTDISTHVNIGNLIYTVKPDANCDVDALISSLSCTTISVYGYRYNIDILKCDNGYLSISLINKTSR